MRSFVIVLEVIVMCHHLNLLTCNRNAKKELNDIRFDFTPGKGKTFGKVSLTRMSLRVSLIALLAI